MYKSQLRYLVVENQGVDLGADAIVEDVAEHYARLEAYDEPELLGDEWEDAEQARASA